MLGAFPPEPGRAAQRCGDDGRDQQVGEVSPAWRFEAQAAQHVELPALGVVEDALVPAVVGGVPKAAQVGEQRWRHRAQRLPDHALRRGQPVAGPNAARSDCRGRVNADPAPTRLPDLGPGVGVALAHRPVAIDVVDLRALVAGDDARRNVHGSHQDDERRRDVFAKAFFAVKPEFVGRVRAVQAGFERVAVAAGAQPLKRKLHQLRRRGTHVFRVTQDVAGEGQRARVEAGRQRNKFAQGQRGLRRPIGEGRIAFDAVARQVGQWPGDQPLQVFLHRGLQPGTSRVRRGGFHHHQPGAVARLHRDFVVERLAVHLKVGACARAAAIGEAGRLPLPAVKLREHRAAKVQIALARHLAAVELDAHDHAVVKRQFGNAADLHAGAQAAAPGHRVGWHAPQRGDARKQHEQQHHHRRAQQRHATRSARGAGQRRLTDRQMRQHQHRQQPEQRHQHAECGEQRLRIKEVAQHAEERQKKHDESVAAGAQLKCFKRQQHDQHGHAGIAPEQGFVREPGGGQREQQQADAPAFTGKRACLQCQPAAPGQHASGQRAAPKRQLPHLGQQHPGNDDEQKNRVAAVARQPLPAC